MLGDGDIAPRPQPNSSNLHLPIPLNHRNKVRGQVIVRYCDKLAQCRTVTQSNIASSSTAQKANSPVISLRFGIGMMIAGLVGWIYYPRIAEYEKRRREERKRELEGPSPSQTSANS
jgi:hypothetical protein